MFLYIWESCRLFTRNIYAFTVSRFSSFHGKDDKADIEYIFTYCFPETVDELHEGKAVLVVSACIFKMLPETWEIFDVFLLAEVASFFA